MKTYRGWAEVEDWHIGREFRRPRKRKSDNEWKKQVREELEEMNSLNEIYVIINEWEASDSKYDSSEVVGDSFFLTEEDAWSHLRDIAVTVDVDLQKGDTVLDVPEPYGLNYETYYIQRLTLKEVP
jgi:hypothetical protein